MNLKFKKVFSILLTTVLMFSAVPLNGFAGLDLPNSVDDDASGSEIVTEEYTTTAVDENIQLCLESAVPTTSNISTTEIPSTELYSYATFNVIVTCQKLDSTEDVRTFVYQCSTETVVYKDDILKAIKAKVDAEGNLLYDPDIYEFADSVYLNGRDEIASIKPAAGGEYTLYVTVSEKQPQIISGTCGDSLTWTLNKTPGILVINGTGSMYSYNSDLPPWHKYDSEIVGLIIEDGVTSIGEKAFGYCYFEKIFIPKSVKNIDFAAFAYCKIIGAVLFSGTEEEWKQITIGLHNESLTSAQIVFNVTSPIEDTTTVPVTTNPPVAPTVPSTTASESGSTLPAPTTTQLVIDTTTRAPVTEKNTMEETTVEKTTVPSSSYDYSGVCGPDLTWTLDDNGVLTIEGSGSMYDFNSGEYITVYVGDNEPSYEYETTTKGAYDYTTVVRPERPTTIQRPLATTTRTYYGTTYIPNTAYPTTTNFYDNYSVAENGSIQIEEETCAVITEENTTAPQHIKTNIVPQAEAPDNYPTNYIRIYRWNKHIDKIKKVVIGDGVTSIGGYAFYNCSNLEEVNISSSISTIGYDAFYNCYALDTVNFNAENINSIYYNAFYNTSVKTLNVGVSVNKIPLVFGGIETVTFADGATVVPDGAFRGCTQLKTVNLPDSITKIGSDAFYNCEALSITKLPESVTYIGSYAFYNCKSLSISEIPENTTHIENNAFYNCDSIKEITIGENVESISYYAFGNCSSLKTLNFNAKNCNNIYYDAFYNCPIKTINVGVDVRHLPEGLSSVETVNVAEGATAVPANAFKNYTKLKTVNLPDSITTIEEYAFANCRSLESFKVGENVSKIEPYAFYGCNALRIVTLGENVTEIGNSAFNRSGINVITINNRLKTIGESAFDSCYSLDNVFYKGTKAEWNNVVVLKNNNALKNAKIFFEDDVTSELNKGLSWSFDDETGTLFINGEGEIGWKNGELPPWNSHRPDVLKVVIGNGITSLGSAMFSDFMCLEEVTLPEGITAIGDWAFDSCIFLSKINLPNTIKSIGDFAFWGCTSLQETRIPGSVETIGMYAFSNCSNLKELTLGNGILKIESSAFEKCSSLESVTIPESVVKIGYDAFYYCTNLKELIFNAINCSFAGASDDVYSAFYGCNKLTDVTIGEKVEHIPACFLSRCKYIEKIYIPDSVKTIGHHAFWHCDRLLDITIGDNIEEIGGWAFDYTAYKYNEENRRDNLICLDYCLIGISGYDIKVDGSITVIQDHVFRSNRNLYSVELPSWMTEIDDFMFDGCWYLHYVKLPENLKKIGAYAFYNCSNLPGLTLPEGVETIGDYAFYYCTAITYMRIPTSVKRIADTAFFGCNTIDLHCEEGSYGCYYAEFNRMNMSIFMKEVGGYCIVKNGVLTNFYGEGFDDFEYHCNLVIPSNVKSIGYYAFENNERIVHIELPYSVNTIHPQAFANCPNLKSVVIPFTVTDIADSAFDGTDATIYCYYNSYAYNYAVKNGIDYELITVTLDTNSINMNMGDTVVINAVSSVPVASGVPVVWKSSDTDIVLIDSTGNIVANGVGSATVGIYSFDGTLFDECAVTVEEPVDEFENVELKYEDVSTDTLKYGEKMLLHINVTDLPEGASIKWVSSNGAILRISNDNAECGTHEGCVTCTVESIGTGSAEITATVVDENGEPVVRDGEEITVSYTMNSKAGFFWKIIAFFKQLFGLSKIILQSVE